MSSKDKEAAPADGEIGDPDSPKRPARTIDLEAEEVKVVDEASGKETSDEDADTTGEDVSSDKEDAPSDLDAAKGKPSPPPQRTRPSDLKSFVTHLAAGLVGGLIGVVGAGIGLDKLQLAGLTGGGSPVSTTVQIEERLDEIATMVSEQGRKIAALPGEAPIEDVKQRLAAIEAGPAPAPGVPPEMAERLAKLEQTLKTLEQAGGGDGASNVEQAAALVARVDGVETALEKRYAVLEDQIAETKSAISQAPASGADSQAAKAAVEAVNERIEALEKKLDTIASRPVAAPVAPDGKAAGVAIAFQALQRAAERGEPFKPQLDSLISLAGDTVDLEALSAMAGKGVPTQNTLLNALPGVLKAARLANARSGDDTFLERLASNAQSVVRVRRIGPVAGSDANAILSRMEANASKGDLKAVIQEAGQLEGAAAENVAPWLEQAKSRAALDAALAKLETRLLANLGARRADKE